MPKYEAPAIIRREDVKAAMDNNGSGSERD